VSVAVGLPAGTTRPTAWLVFAGVLGALCVSSLVLVWSTQQRVRTLEQELVRRQQSSQDQSTEARLLARQAHDAAADVAAKQLLLETRVSESALQRSQVEELIQSLSRSRDENVLADVEAALRVAQQQAAITGSVEPIVAALRQSDERLARYDQPRVERVRRAVARDLDKSRAVVVADLPSLSLRLDELIRQVDDLPLLSAPSRRGTVGGREPLPPAGRQAPAVAAAGRVAAASSASVPATSAAQAVAGVYVLDWWAVLVAGWDRVRSDVADEARALLRVTRIDQPEAMLVAPEQAFFLRENLKLRLLNARLALLSRQFDLAQSDLGQARAALERYFDRGSRRVTNAIEQVGQVAAQTKQVPLPRPDETLAALAAAAAGR
jgi:uroporphyrin-III C-methyltransferase